MASDISMTFGKTVGPSWTASGGLKSLTADETNRGWMRTGFENVAALLQPTGYGFDMGQPYSADLTLEQLKLWWMSRPAEVRLGQLHAHGVRDEGIEVVLEISNRMRIDDVNFIALPAVVFSILDMDSRLAALVPGDSDPDVAPPESDIVPPEAPKPPDSHVEAGMGAGLSKAWPWLLGAGAVAGLIYWGSKD